MLLRSILILFLALNGSLFLTAQNNQTSDLAKHEGVISHFDQPTKTLLRTFADVVTHYSDSAFFKLFALDFIDYCKTSELYRNDPLEDAIWGNLTVALDDRDQYFDRSMKIIMEKGTYKNVNEIYFVGQNEFGGSGFQVFYKLIMNNGTNIGGRIFLHPSGPNGRLEIHGSYG